MPETHITLHAIARYQERVEDVPPIEACRRLNSQAIRAAVEFGAPYVRLPGGQRVVINGDQIITVLPKDHSASSLGTARDDIHGREVRDGAG